ncbi:hypothetical protein [Citrobacter meridianamericanus]|uniref:hypothetical protein n=1 Tax=Citrobacter meridianamericanus TaxID=2894201 RepID=UPI00397A1EAC
MTNNRIAKALGALLLVLSLGFLVALAGGVEWGTPAAGGIAFGFVFVGLIFFAVGVAD